MTKTFRKDTERCRKRGYDMELLKTPFVLQRLTMGQIDAIPKDRFSVSLVELLKLWESTYMKKEGYVSQWKQKRTELTEAVVAKYAALTEDEIKTLVVERKWLASVVGGCEALMQNVTHQIASDVTTLAERYEVTLGATESNVNDLEQEVLRSLKEMGFTL